MLGLAEKVDRKRGKLTVQADEMGSFVGNKKQKQWLWLALDRDTKEIVGFYLVEENCQKPYKIPKIAKPKRQKGRAGMG